MHHSDTLPRYPIGLTVAAAYARFIAKQVELMEIYSGTLAAPKISSGRYAATHLISRGIIDKLSPLSIYNYFLRLKRHTAKSGCFLYIEFQTFNRDLKSFKYLAKTNRLLTGALITTLFVQKELMAAGWDIMWVERIFGRKETVSKWGESACNSQLSEMLENHVECQDWAIVAKTF